MQKNILLFAVSVLVLQTAALAQTPSVTPAPVQKPSLQQQFDEATKASEASDWQKAYDIYVKLETALAAKTPPSKSLGIVRLRKGQMLYQLGKETEGVAAITEALAKIDEKDTSLSIDRADAYLTLALSEEARFDYVSAVDRLQTALSISTEDASKILIYLRLIPIRIFVDANAALADADTALAILARNPDINKEWLGVIRNLRGRTLTNLGRLKEARADLKIAIAKLGGLETSKINLLDASARSDASIAAMRDKDPEQGRLMLAYTESAQASDGGFRLGVGMEPPACGGINGPKPDDVAVVEFNIRDDGRVGKVRPVYYSGERAVAVQFAQAVSQWFWDTQTLAKLDPFFRSLTRLELRCTTTFEKSNATDLLLPALEAWLKLVAPASLSLPSPSSDRAGLDALNAAMVDLTRKNGADTADMIVPLSRLSAHPLIPFDLSVNYAKRAYDIAKKNQAPAQVLAFFANKSAGFLNKSYYNKEKGEYQTALSVALSDPAINKDERASAALRLSFFDSLDANARNLTGVDVLSPIANDSRLPDNDPYKVGALTRLASVAVNNGKVEDARNLFAKTGLSAQQCALVDAKPVQTGGTIKSKDYPTEALQLGLGGWTVVEFDIDANGRTARQRPLIAWPPFIFGDPAAKNIASFQFQQSYRPDGGLGCGGQRQRVSYFVPK